VIQQQEDTTKRDMMAEIKSLMDIFREEMLKLTADVKASLQLLEQRGSTLALQQRHVVVDIPNVQSVHSKQVPRNLSIGLQKFLYLIINIESIR
jgi:hypothetical protein